MYFINFSEFIKNVNIETGRILFYLLVNRSQMMFQNVNAKIVLFVIFYLWVKYEIRAQELATHP